MFVLTMNKAEGTELLSLTHFNPQNEMSDITKLPPQKKKKQQQTCEAGRLHRAQVGETFEVIWTHFI